MRRLIWLVLFAAIAGCQCLPKVNINVNLPQVDLNKLGSNVLTDVGNARLDLDPTVRDALTAVGQCADVVTWCYDPPNADLSHCLDAVPSCLTDSPWNEAACCPKACKQAFTDEVNKGTAQRDAFEKVIFLQPDCFPGVRTLLESP